MSRDSETLADVLLTLSGVPPQVRPSGLRSLICVDGTRIEIWPSVPMRVGGVMGGVEVCVAGTRFLLSPSDRDVLIQDLQAAGAL